ncbi:amidase [Secundilactobacillus paracollinoides]|uniref:amidase n=1 Tax=Secundilactobacillus paracollinoides TaxID=240427 RepID=UPI0006D1350F|nr:amidase [Secundilactobacillus paracollinoides]KRL75828.1 amidase [Secundilactobacillus paracollinoides DSM 15502 = JCM 11969]
MKTALALAQQVRQGTVSATTLVKEALERVAAGNDALNAVTATREQAALAEAAALEDHGQPFLGVPLLIKGLGQSLAGSPNTSGSRLLAGSVASQTDFFVQQLQAAGFIIIGQTNVPEFGFKNITDSKLYGPAHNAWNRSYSPGGSSGGSAASVAAGIVPIAAASDGGGSIRIPASFSGLVGLKPTRGRVPVGPGDWRSWQGAAINFALTRSVDDTAALLDAMQTVQPAAVFQVPLNEHGYLATLNDAKLVKVAYSTKSPVGTPVSADAVQAVEDAASFLSDQGYDLVEAAPDLDGVALMDSYYVMNEAETTAMFDELATAFGRAITRDEVEPLTWALGETGRHLSAAQYSESLGLWDQASYTMAKFQAQYPLYLTPTTAMPAPSVDDPLISDENLEKIKAIEQFNPDEQQQLIYDQWLPALTRSPFTQQANLTGQPATSLPTHVSDAGLPLGVQLTALKGQEALLLQTAKLFERENQFHLLNL